MHLECYKCSIKLEDKKLDNSLLAPQIRIEKIHLKNFKGVNDGVIEFNCLRNPFEKEIQSDILGLYGQNGSGKTTMLEALQIAKLLMMGQQISEKKYKNVVSQGAEYAQMEISFQFVNKDETVFHLEYAFSLGYKEVPDLSAVLKTTVKSAAKASSVLGETASALALLSLSSPLAFPTSLVAASVAATSANLIKKKSKNTTKKQKTDDHFPTVKTFTVFNETLRLSGNFNGVEYRYGAIFDAGEEAGDSVFLPKAKHQEFFPVQTSLAIKELAKFKERAINGSKSFIFSDDVSHLIYEQLLNGAESALAGLIVCLKTHAVQNIKVLDSIVIGASRDNVIPLYTSNKGIGIRLDDSTTYVDEDGLAALQTSISGLNVILEQLIPGLTIRAVAQKDYDSDEPQASNTRTDSKYVIYSVRNGTRIPIAQESTGILHLISALGLISFAFSNPCATVAIDEIDAGVYEYLLGELLLIFEKYGSGQLIFTCHNLRPLEVLNRKFICFTTTNPDNRYLRLKYVRKEKNLREEYLQEIVGGGQSEELYSSAKHGKIASALQKAGEILG